MFANFLNNIYIQILLKLMNKKKLEIQRTVKKNFKLKEQQFGFGTGFN